MKPTVYLETTIVGYLAMRVSGVLRVAANQQTTRDWWDSRRQGFDLFVSRFVVDECSDGDPEAAQDRLAYLKEIPLLQVSDNVNALAETLIAGVPLPRKCSHRRAAYFRCCGQWCRILTDLELQAHRKSIYAATN